MMMATGLGRIRLFGSSEQNFVDIECWTLNSKTWMIFSFYLKKYLGLSSLSG